MAKLDPITPGEILAEEFMEPCNVSQNKLARDLDIPISRVNTIIKGSRAITADTAMRLGKYFGTSAQFWMNLQTNYDLRMAEREIWPKVEGRVRTLDVA